MRTLSKLSQILISSYSRQHLPNLENKISVNPVVAELASWYEKFRTAMDYREDEVILRSAIERILKRRLLFSNDGLTVAAPLIRELVWARYFPDLTVPETQVQKVAHTIDLFLRLEKEINREHRIGANIVNEWILHILSSEIEDILKPGNRKDLMANFIFQLFKDRIEITDDTREVKDIQLYIAVRRAYANDDLALLRYRLFKQYFGAVSGHNIEKISDQFLNAIKHFETHFKYPLKDKIYNYINDQKVPFLILDDVLRKNQAQLSQLFSDEDSLNVAILEACNNRYKAIKGKVGRAIVRSVVFIFVTKALFALFVEGVFERAFYGGIIWSSIALNTLTPPILMILVGLSIQTPGKENSYRIMGKINSILFEEDAQLNGPLTLRKKPAKTDPILDALFLILWFATFALSFGAIIFILSKFQVNPLSQAIFIFFLAIVSFISYRVNKTAHMYILRDKKESLYTIAFDFFFMPFIQVGRKLTSAVSQLNIFLFIFDFIIETPFKGIVAFFEQWLLFLRTQREKLD
ncbi:hypothetical protein HYT18_04730 [Candidatus Microgenomates bacterium]|nr:hypothetical protein [Candidatus Microgenomates bacterium]